MIVVDNDMVIFFDVDETLVKWSSNDPYIASIIIKNGDCEERVWPHKKHIEQLKRHRARGHKIVVWSAGGHAWAKEVVTNLNLTDYVDVVMSKPQWFYDDLTASEFMPESKRIYYKED